MDDIVRQAMAKWPHVPDCYGWLGLDARGNWYMRDEAAQAAGAFGSGRPRAKGSMLQHAKLIDFIARNYAADERGCWYFQNGPQRVYVELEAAPWVWRVDSAGSVTSHTGQTIQVQHAIVDEVGWLYAWASQGLGVVHTQDMEYAAHMLEAGMWTLESAQRQALPQRCGFVKSPSSLQA